MLYCTRASWTFSLRPLRALRLKKGVNRKVRKERKDRFHAVFAIPPLSHSRMSNMWYNGGTVRREFGGKMSATQQTTKNIFCMKWGTKFPPSYVNILADMVRRNLAPPYRFVCFTEDGKGLDPSIEVRPLPEMQLEHSQPERGWRKLTVLGNNLGSDLSGQALFLDLDVVILDNLQPFFEQAGQFVIIHEWGFSDPIIGNSSVFRFEIGKHQDVLEHFVKHRGKVREEHRNEQAYLSHSIHRKGMLTYWDKTWCRSFKRHCMQPFPLCHFLTPKKPTGAKIVIFHGRPHPDDMLTGWSKHFGLRAAKPADWINENWCVQPQK